MAGSGGAGHQAPIPAGGAGDAAGQAAAGPHRCPQVSHFRQYFEGRIGLLADAAQQAAARASLTSFLRSLEAALDTSGLEASDIAEYCSPYFKVKLVKKHIRSLLFHYPSTYNATVTQSISNIGQRKRRRNPQQQRAPKKKDKVNGHRHAMWELLMLGMMLRSEGSFGDGSQRTFRSWLQYRAQPTGDSDDAEETNIHDDEDDDEDGNEAGNEGAAF